MMYIVYNLEPHRKCSYGVNSTNANVFVVQHGTFHPSPPPLIPSRAKALGLDDLECCQGCAK